MYDSYNHHTCLLCIGGASIPNYPNYPNYFQPEGSGMQSGAGMSESKADVSRSDIVEFVQSFGLNISINGSSVVLTCSDNTLNATFRAYPLFSLCQLSSLLKFRRPSRLSFLNYTVLDVRGQPAGQGCAEGLSPFLMNLIIVLSASGGGALLIILFCGICTLVLRAVIESKRNDHPRCVCEREGGTPLHVLSANNSVECTYSGVNNSRSKRKCLEDQK